MSTCTSGCWADAMVCLVSPAYLASTWCTAAQVLGSRPLPLRVEPGLAHPLLSADISGSEIDPVGRPDPLRT